MDQDLKDKWVKALRSGEYKQGAGYFKYDGKYCCLGVLSEVAGRQLISRDGGEWSFADQTVGGSSITWRLANMNDSGKSFPEIADYIEKNL